MDFLHNNTFFDKNIPDVFPYHVFLILISSILLVVYWQTKTTKISLGCFYFMDLTDQITDYIIHLIVDR